MPYCITGLIGGNTAKDREQKSGLANLRVGHDFAGWNKPSMRQ